MAVGNVKKYLAIDGYEGGLTEEVTPWAGVGLFLELFRRVGVGAAVERVVPAKKSPKGLRPGEMVEAFTLLSALGGDCVDDFAHLRLDEGLRAILGYQLPAPPTARQSLGQAHEVGLVVSAREEAQQAGFLSYIPAESTYLRGLKEGNRQVVHSYVRVVKLSYEVTFDVDAHLVESAKQSALRCYDGNRGFQPMIVSWAETNLVVKDEFRDGNVPAGKDMVRVVRVYPSDKFGANAAWLKLQVLTHNLLELLKAAVLPEKYRKARPKKLRFAVFTLWGKVVRHAHKTVVRIITRAMEEMIGSGRRLIRSLAWSGG